MRVIWLLQSALYQDLCVTHLSEKIVFWKNWKKKFVMGYALIEKIVHIVHQVSTKELSFRV